MEGVLGAGDSGDGGKLLNSTEKWGTSREYRKNWGQAFKTDKQTKVNLAPKDVFVTSYLILLHIFSFHALARPGMEPAIHHIRGGRAIYYTTTGKFIAKVIASLLEI